MEALVFNTNVYGSILLLIVTAVFFFSQLKRDNSVMDIVYGPIFLFSGIITMILTENTSLLALIIITATAIWSTRLSLRIFKKNYGKPEDIRYANWRNLWMKRGRLYFTLRSYYQINLLQGIIILFVSAPFIISLVQPSKINYLFLIFGLLVFSIGLTIETIADHQLDRFMSAKKAGTERANLMVTGLFKYSRRPNYFGETLVWWGLAIIVLPLPFGYLGLLSPLLITFIVTKVTGPMLEKIFLEKYPKEYSEYMKKTSYFIPLPPSY